MNEGCVFHLDDDQNSLILMCNKIVMFQARANLLFFNFELQVVVG